jgi:hypothetical protein
MKPLLVFLFAVLSTWPRPALAGPPFQMDDPDVIPYKHFEFYTFSTVGSTPGEVDTAGPAVELNWSGVHNVMFHFIVPAGAAFLSDGPATFGLTDSEAGLQFRFVQETKHRPMVGTFTMLEIPTGNPDRGLGAGKPSWKIPIWMQKSIGPWTLDWGGGENISHIPGARNYPFGGTLLQHDLGKKLTLGGEVYYHGRETAGTLSSRYATMVDIGGYYTLHDPGFQLLFCYGHTVAGQTENYAYLGLYWTWGPKSRSHN